MKTIVLAMVLSLAAWQGVAAQTADKAREPLREPYITSTGATVDKPGASQSAGVTKEDRAIQRRDKRIDDSICKDC